MKISKRFANVGDSSTLKITSLAKSMKSKNIDVAILAAGEPDFDTPDKIKEEAIKAIKEGFTGYTAVRGINELLELICEKFKKENNLEYKPENIIVSTGAKQSIYNVLQALCDEDSEVILLAPYWVSYIEMVKMTGAVPVIVDTSLDNFRINVDRVKEKITKKTRMIIINSPNNPTGVVFTEKELKALADLIVEHNIYCISDEIYEKIIYSPNKHYSIASFNDKIKDLTFTVNGLSKTYAMTGWRIGYLGGEKKLVEKALMVQTHSTSCTSSISQKAAVAALKLDEKIVNKMIDEFAKRREFLMKKVEKIEGLKYVEPQGAFYLFVDFRKFIGKKFKDSEEICTKLLEDYKVAVIPGGAFGAEGFIRISYAASMSEIEKGIERIEKFLKENV
ncbi:MAG: pyridoxal phosphate-dependent aminotransferase [candidate division WOR-3 bacterium]